MKKVFRVLTSLLILLILIHSPAKQADAQPRFSYRYVVPGGSKTSTECTASDPCDLRYAIDSVANDGDIMIVHSGTYFSELMGPDLIFINKNLTLWGSCEFDASTPFQCFPEEHNSILDAENAKRVIRIEGTDVEEVAFEGFTIMRGTGVGMVPCLGGYSGCGAGIHASKLGKLTLKNNSIWQNKAGSTSGAGGGLYAEGINFLQAERNTFIFNQATDTGAGVGGGVLVRSSGGTNAVEFHQNLFYKNECSSETGHNQAGAGLMITGSNNVQITDNMFQDQNLILEDPDIQGSALYLSYNTVVSVEGNHFKNGYGGSAVYISGDSDTEGLIARNKWWNNLGYYNLHLRGPVKADVVNNFLGRQPISALSRGGGSTSIYLEGDELFGSNDIGIVFNTFAATNRGVAIGQYSNVKILSNIFTGLSDAITSDTTHVIRTINNNLFFGNLRDNFLGIDYILEDPKLADISSGDFHLLPGSGAINRSICGDFDIDIDGQSRPFGPGLTPCDVGADEFYAFIYLPFITK